MYTSYQYYDHDADTHVVLSVNLVNSFSSYYCKQIQNTMLFCTLG